jgi:DNA-binding PadR family transcriptional regulator
MSTSSVSFRHFILGLLTRRPMSGYDIKRSLKSLAWLVGNPSFGSLYPALHALLNDGWVTVEVDSRQDRPSRKIYSITETGRQALEEWVNQPAGPNASMKAFVMRLILADNLSQAGLIAQLHQRRAQVAAHRATLEQTAGVQDDGADLGQRLALDYGIALATTELAWLDSTLNQLFQGPLSTEGVQGNTPAIGRPGSNVYARGSRS